MEWEFDPDRRKRGRVGSNSSIQPMRPRREGVGRALASVFGFHGQIMPIDLDALLEELDAASPKPCGKTGGSD